MRAAVSYLTRARPLGPHAMLRRTTSLDGGARPGRLHDKRYSLPVTYAARRAATLCAAATATLQS